MKKTNRVGAVVFLAVPFAAVGADAAAAEERPDTLRVVYHATTASSPGSSIEYEHPFRGRYAIGAEFIGRSCFSARGHQGLLSAWVSVCR